MEDFKPNKKDMFHKTTMLKQALFYEVSSYRDNAQYTLLPYDRELEDGRVLPSIKKLYLEMEDPSEFLFANKYFLDWEHWQAIRSNKVLNKYVNKEKGFDAWSDELEIKMRAQALMALNDVAKNDGNRGVSAAKYIAEFGWTKKKGRPSKEENDRTDQIEGGIFDHVAKVVNLHGKDES